MTDIQYTRTIEALRAPVHLWTLCEVSEPYASLIRTKLNHPASFHAMLEVTALCIESGRFIIDENYSPVLLRCGARAARALKRELGLDLNPEQISAALAESLLTL